MICTAFSGGSGSPSAHTVRTLLSGMSTKPPDDGLGAAEAAGAGAGAGTGAAAAALHHESRNCRAHRPLAWKDSMSALVMRLLGPVPVTLASAMPARSASFFASGLANTRPAAAGAAGAGMGAAAGAVTGAGVGAAAAAAACDARSAVQRRARAYRLGRGGGGGGGGIVGELRHVGGIVNGHGNGLVDIGLLTLAHNDLGQHAVIRRVEGHHGLVRLHLCQRLARLERLAGKCDARRARGWPRTPPSRATRQSSRGSWLATAMASSAPRAMAGLGDEN